MCDVKNGPGKFEGEPCYAESAWTSVLDGFGEIVDFADGTSIDVLHVDAEFRSLHGIADDVVAIAAEESDSGFVTTAELTAAGLAELREAAAASRPACGACGNECDPDTYDPDRDIGECCLDETVEPVIDPVEPQDGDYVLSDDDREVWEYGGPRRRPLVTGSGDDCDMAEYVRAAEAEAEAEAE